MQLILLFGGQSGVESVNLLLSVCFELCYVAAMKQESSKDKHSQNDNA